MYLAIFPNGSSIAYPELTPDILEMVLQGKAFVYTYSNGSFYEVMSKTEIQEIALVGDQ